MARTQTIDSDAAWPEADRLEGQPHPRETFDLRGQQNAQDILSEAITSRRIHHAWLLGGPKGIGKATLAYHFARALLCIPEELADSENPFSAKADSKTSRQVIALSHPRLLVIRRPYDPKTKRFPAAIPVDEVRRLRSFLSHTAESGTRRVVIVDSADELNISAANALLKSLEEPPPRTVFILISSAPGRLLPTIRSRCRRLSLDPLDADDLKAVVHALLSSGTEGTAMPEPELDKLIQMANGSVYRALALIEYDGLQMQARIENFFANLPRMDDSAIHVLADQLSGSQHEQQFQLFLDLFEEALADQARRPIMTSATGASVTSDTPVIPIERVAALAKLWETLARDRAQAWSLNLDRKALILHYFESVEALSRGA